ncbi:uncharacterized protein LOC136066421 [Quercus suber]|uniref:uncharacterized protein LOC136066421 n=1 Tax=Quercus suber TaxID=58331 RepID=UPI0032DF0BBE
MAIIAYGIAYLENKLQPQDSKHRSICRLICLLCGIVAFQLALAMLISPYWLFMVDLWAILIVGVLRHSYQQIYHAANVVLKAVPSLFQKIYQFFYQIYVAPTDFQINLAASQAFSSKEQGDNQMAQIV